jgi:Domain of unknown function (DUF4394)
MTILSHAYALSDANTLVSFNPAAPAVGTSIPVTGLMAGETLVGIDVRPANGVLYALGVDAAINTATLYTISPLTGVATVVGTLSGLSGNLTTASGYGFDFNPVSGFIRVTTDTGLNFRINPDTASVVNDPMINPAGLEISGVAYTNDEIGVTTLYTLDSISDHLMIQGGIDGIPSPNGGVQTQVGPIPVGVDFSTANGFDIPPGVDSGLALLTVGGTTQLYSINLVTGAGTLIGDFLPLDGITPASGLAILNPPSGADFNVDGRGDILFRHDSGVVYLWEMNGLQIKEEGSPSHAPVTSTSRASATSTATSPATFSGGKTAAPRSISGRWPANRFKRRALSRTLSLPTTGTSRASAISTAMATATFSGVRTAAARSMSGR